MEPTNLQGVLIIKGWDLEAQLLSLLLSTARLIDSSSGESALEPPFLGCSRRGEKGERERRSQSSCKVERLLEKCGEAGNTDIMGWRPRVWRGRNQRERVGEGH